MNKRAIFPVTEWEWLKLQFKIHEIESKAYYFGSYFDIEDEGDVIVCSIFNNFLDETLRVTPDKEELLEEYFLDWVEAEKHYIKTILEKFPLLEKEFDIEKDMVFQIMPDYRMESSIVCKIIGQKVEWTEGQIKELVKKHPASILVAKFLKKFEEFAEYLRKTYSNTVIRVNSYHIGILSDSPGNRIDIVCVLPDKPLNKPNEVSLSVEVFNLHGHPMLTAKIEWRKTYFLYAPVSFELVPFSQDALSRLEAAIPVLCDALEAAVRRGHPAFSKGEDHGFQPPYS